MKIGKKTARWILAFLTNRQNYVQIGDIWSNIYLAESGVPAGSTLGPLLFLIFINDIVDVVEYSSILLFADDIKMSVEINSSLDSSMLQFDINKLLDWCEENKLFFNFSKCVMLTFSRSRSPVEIWVLTPLNEKTKRGISEST